MIPYLLYRLVKRFPAILIVLLIGQQVYATTEVEEEVEEERIETVIVHNRFSHVRAAENFEDEVANHYYSESHTGEVLWGSVFQRIKALKFGRLYIWHGALRLCERVK